MEWDPPSGLILFEEFSFDSAVILISLKREWESVNIMTYDKFLRQGVKTDTFHKISLVVYPSMA